MAKMYGKIKYKFFNSCRLGCCEIDFDKSTIKRREETLAFREAEDEMYDERDEKHKRGICYDPKSKMYGCDYCYDSTDPYDNADLEGIPGVWCDVDWRADLGF